MGYEFQSVINLKKHHLKKRNITSFFIIAAIIVIIALAVLFYLKFAATKESTAAANVNGEVITTEYINRLYTRLPAESQNKSREMEIKLLILNQTIEDTLLLQEANNNGITVTDEEVANDINLTLEENGMTKEDFMQLLKTNDISYEEAVQDFKQRLIIYRLINQTILSKIDVTDSEIEAYYSNNLANQTEITLNQSSEQIKQIVYNEKAYAAILTYVAQIRAKSTVEIFMS
jgi:parvulin-like peptidyl-prolyl isomerase